MGESHSHSHVDSHAHAHSGDSHPIAVHAVEGLHGPTFGHEKSDINIVPPLIVAAGLAAVTLGTMFVLWFVMRGIETFDKHDDLNPSGLVNARPLPPEPRLQPSSGHASNDREDMARLRENEDKILTTYAWQDPNKTVARVPIERAMRFALQQGLLPAQSAEKGAPNAPSH